MPVMFVGGVTLRAWEEGRRTHCARGFNGDIDVFFGADRDSGDELFRCFDDVVVSD